MFYDNELYEINGFDMAKAELDSEFGVIVLDKKLFSLKRKKRFKIKLVVEHGEMKKIIIHAPYGFMVKLFEMFNYQPLICQEHSIVNKRDVLYRYIYSEEWSNPHYQDDDAYRSESIFNVLDELPF